MGYVSRARWIAAACIGLGAATIAACSSDESAGGTSSGGGSSGSTSSTSPASNCPSRCAAIASACALPSGDCERICGTATESELSCMESSNCDGAAYEACMGGSSTSSGGTSTSSSSGSTSSSSGGSSSGGSSGGTTGCADPSKTFACDTLNCKLTQICVKPRSGTVGAEVCYDVKEDHQCTPCSTQASAVPKDHCSFGYRLKLSGSGTTGCTATCE